MKDYAAVYTKLTKIINNKKKSIKQIYKVSIRRKKGKKLGVKFFHIWSPPYIENLLHFDWMSHYLLSPRGQSHLAAWQQLLITRRGEFSNCRQVRYLGSKLHHQNIRYLGGEPQCAYFSKLHTRFLSSKRCILEMPRGV
jgi:hypothetical protein